MDCPCQKSGFYSVSSFFLFLFKQFIVHFSQPSIVTTYLLPELLQQSLLSIPNTATTVISLKQIRSYQSLLKTFLWLPVTLRVNPNSTWPFTTWPLAPSLTSSPTLLQPRWPSCWEHTRLPVCQGRYTGCSLCSSCCSSRPSESSVLPLTQLSLIHHLSRENLLTRLSRVALSMQSLPQYTVLHSFMVLITT